jgi:two-component system, chemotaxis family, CheB/CheR fusion protein
MRLETPPVSTGRPEPQGSAARFPIVAVGASAGGLEALEILFEHMPRTTGMAFVVLQHLSPDFESRMDELLARKTSVPVRKVVDGMEVEPDAIYLMPPRKEMIIAHGRLVLSDKDPDAGLALPIDIFFRSLAVDLGSHAVGVILSGSGSDGSRGIREIHQVGGLAIAQAEDTARFDGMPKAALQTGDVDLVLAPQDMPRALVLHAEKLRTGVDLLRNPPEGSLVPVTGMDKVFELLRNNYGIDFTHYKPNTVSRRLQRRLDIIQAPDVDTYANRLESSPAELDALYCDLLIGVTKFFRDAEAFEQLERHVLPAILANTSPRDEIRVWTAGCATGEEAYSLAILFHERLTAAGRPPNVKIFATDVHRGSLDIASAGVYDEAALAETDPVRINRYFTRRENKYVVAKEIRQLIVFAPHNVISDAPFTRLDLLTCRNLLIYLQPQAQKKALALFHFGLKTGGALFLGPSEAPGDVAEHEFEPVDKRWRLYKKRRDVRLMHAMRTPLLPHWPQRRPKVDGGWPAAAAEPNMQGIYDRLLVRFMPSGLLVDEQFNLIHCFGGAEKFVRIPGGRPSSALSELILPQLKTPVSGALQQAAKDRKVVSFTGVPVRTDDEETVYRIQVEPFPDERTRSITYLVSIESVGPPRVSSADGDVAVDMGQMSQDRIDTLETELRFTKESLQATIEELETSNEELQATNEELVAANEELQSTNEELHSVNEELYTVNGELQRKIAELTETSADLDSVLSTTDVGVLFLDLECRIRRFTPKMSEAFHLLPQDVGRAIDAFTSKLDHPDLTGEIRRVLETGHPTDLEATSHDGHHWYLRIIPYQQVGRRAGVVLTILDITSLRRAEQDRRILAAIVESSADAIVATDQVGVITHWNRGAERMYGWGPGDVIGTPLSTVFPDERERLAEMVDRTCRGGQVLEVETVRKRKDGSPLSVSLQVSPIRGPRDQIAGMSSIDRDITPRKRDEEQIRQAVQQREQFLAVLSHELRNPLAAVVSAVRLLRSPDADGLRARALTVLERQTVHMARLLDDLLDVSRVRQGRLEVRKELVDLRQVVEAALETVAATYEDLGVQLVADLGNNPAALVGDPQRLRQLVVNLLTNAARHSDRGDSVWVTLKRRRDRLAVHVRDEGTGINSEDIGRIFEPFGVAQPATGRAGGLGVGLWLVRSIAEAHDGRVTVKSAGQGHGSEFVIDLPVAAARTAGAARHTLRNAHGPIDATVVLIEDQDDVRDLMEAILAAQKITVFAAADGEAGLELIRRHAPEVALVDLGLPGISGFEIARRLREELPPDRLRLVALTGFGQQSDREAVYDAGFDHHLVKPVDIDDLLSVIRVELTRLSRSTESTAPSTSPA